MIVQSSHHKFDIVDDVLKRVLHHCRVTRNMYGQAASNWIVDLYSLFDPTNFLPFLPNLWNKQAIGSRYSSDTKVRDTDVLVGYLILFWVLLYLLYEKCLNVSLTDKY